MHREVRRGVVRRRPRLNYLLVVSDLLYMNSIQRWVERSGALVGSLTGMVAIKLFVAGLQRSVSVLFQRVVRLKKVDQALQGPIARRREVRDVLADLEIVLGTYQGKLTLSMGAFLEELEKSGVVEVMVQCALLEKDSQKVRTAFTELYARFLPPSKKECDAFYEGLMRAFAVIHREFSKDKTVFDLLRLQHSEISNRLASVESAIKRSKDEVVSFEQLESTIQKIAKGAQAALKNVRIETHRGAQNVEIAKIYIAPKVQYRNREALTKTIRSVGLQDSTFSPSSSHLIERRDQEPAFLIPYADMKASFRRIVILGDPGGGKSTLCQRLCFDMARSATLALAGGSRKEIPAQEQKIPIRIVLRQFEQARQQDPQLDIKTFVSRDLLHTVAANQVELEQTLTYLLSSGRALLAFDGLDEILDTARRREYVDLVSSFCNMYPLCPVLVTSRVVGYDIAPMAADFEEFVLERFDNSEVAAYALKFMVVVAGRDAAKGKEQADKFIEQTAANASDLRRNPLMLGLMCWLFYWTGDVPTNRPEIYKECAILMFEKWDPNRGIFADVPKDFDRLQLFTYLASKIYGVPELAGGVTTEWLQREAEVYFRTLYADRGKAVGEARRLVRFLTGRAWVMTEVGDGVFAFTHQTFLEYFFARSIDDACDRIDDVLKVILPRVVRREWDVVNHLALQIKSHRNTRRQEEALDSLVRALGAARAIARRRALSSFLASSLEYLSATEPAVQRAIEALFTNALSMGQAMRGSRFADLSKALRIARERKDFSTGVVAQLIAGALLGTDIATAEVVAGSIYLVESRNTLGEGDRSIPLSVVDLVKSKIKARFVSRELESPFAAAIAWSWFGRLVPEKFAGAAVEWLFKYPPIGSYISINGLLACALGASESHSADICDSSISKATYRRALDLIGRDGFSGREICLDAEYERKFGAHPPDFIWAESISEALSQDAPSAVGAYFGYCVQQTLRRSRDSTSESRAKFAELQQRLHSIVREDRWPTLAPALAQPTAVNVRWTAAQG
jgi:hypothetical protein